MADNLESWGTTLIEGESPDVLIKNNGTLRIYAKNRAFNKDLIVGVSVDNSTDFREVQKIELDKVDTTPGFTALESYFMVPSNQENTKLSKDNWRKWFVDTATDTFYEIISTKGIYKALPYKLKK